MKTGYKVCDAMTKAPIYVSTDASVQECAKIMNEQRVGSVLVQKDNKLAGIITDQDIVRKIIAKGIDPSETKVEKHMVKELLTITPDKDIFDAITLMASKNVKQLPVMDGKKLIVLLTQKDILKIEPELFDLLVDKLEIKEEPHKPHLHEGNCNECGNFSDRLIDREGSFICKHCAK